MKQKKFFLAFIIPFLFFSVKISATEDEAIRNARNMAETVKENYNVCFRSTFSHGILNEGESHSYKEVFYKGVTYYLIAGGCSYCKDIDLSIYDGYGKLVDSDTHADKTAIVSFTPTVSGEFTVRVKMYKATASEVHWSVLSGYICN